MRTTNKQFEEFKDSFKEWVIKFGLMDYHISYECKPIPGYYAQLWVNEDGKCATATLNSEFSKESYKEFNPKASGKHEAIHLLLNKLAHLGSERFISEREIDDESEAIVRVLEKWL